MWKVVEVFNKIVDTLNEWVGKTFSWAMFLCMIIVVINVFMRYVLRRPMYWTHEASVFLYGGHFMLGSAYALKHKAHVGIDFITELLDERKRLIIDIIGHIIFVFPFLIVVCIYGYYEAARSWAGRETTWSVWGPPIYPYKSVIPVTMALLILQSLVHFLNNIRNLLDPDYARKKGSEVDA